MSSIYKRSLEPELKQLMLPAAGDQWKSLRRFDTFSRYAIDDTEFDVLDNFLPMGPMIRQTPGATASFATLPGGTAIWINAQEFQAGIFIFVLSTNGKLYQIAPGGSIVTCNASGTLGANSDIANWEGTTILVTDPSTNTIYSWNGTTFATLFTSQPATRLAVFGGRLWGANNSTIWYTAGGTFNSLGGDAGSLLITDSACTSPIQALFTFGGLLYIFGASWIQVLGNLYVSGTPAVLQFTIYTLESQVGTTNRWSIAAYGSYLYFANNYGVFQLQGSFPIKLSEQLDGYFVGFQVSTTLSCGYTTVYGQPCLFWHAVTSDGTQCVFGVSQDGQWFRGVFGTLTFITGFFDTSGNPILYGTDGTHLFSLFTNTTSNVTSVAKFKFWNFGSAIGFKGVQKVAVTNVANQAATVTVALLNDTSQEVASNTFTYLLGYIWLDHNGNPYTWLDHVSNPYTWTESAVQFNVSQLSGTFRSRIFSIDLTITGMGTSVYTVSFETKVSEAGWGS